MACMFLFTHTLRVIKIRYLNTNDVVYMDFVKIGAKSQNTDALTYSSSSVSHHTD